MADGRIEIDTNINTNGIDKGSNNVKKSLNNLGEKVESWAKKFQDDFEKSSAPLTELTSAVELVTGTISKAIDITKGYCEAINETAEAYNVQLRAETQLSTAAKNNPYLNKESVQNLKNFASSVQEYSVYGDELMSFMAQLASAGRSEKEIMDIITVSADIASSDLMSFDSAVSALNETFLGSSDALGEINGAIQELTEEQLKQGEAVKIVKEQYKGMAKAVAEATGAAQKAANTIGDLKKEIGKITKPAVDEWNRFWNKFATWGIESVGKVKESLDNMSRNFGGIKKEVDEGVKTLNSYSMVTGEKAVQKQTKEALEWYKKELEYRQKIGKLDNEALQVYGDITQELRFRNEQEEELNKISKMNTEELNNFYNLVSDKTAKAAGKVDEWKNEYKDLFEIIEKLNTGDLDNLKKYKNYSKNGYSADDILTLYNKDKREIDSLREQAQKAQEKINEPILSAEQKLQKYYTSVIEAKKKEIELRKKAGETITEESEAQELAQEQTKAYIEYLKQGGTENNAVLEEINRTYEKLKKISNESVAISAKDTYKNSLAAVEREFEIRKKMNETISEEEELEAKLNAKRQAYLKLRTSTKDSQISDNNSEISLAKTNKEIEELEQRLNKIRTDKLKLLKEAISEVTEEKDPIQELKNTLSSLEVIGDSVKEEIIALESKEDLSNNEIQRLQDLIFAYDEYERKIKIVRKELEKTNEQKTFENVLSTMQKLNEGINNLSSATNILSEMWSKQFEDEATIATANLEKQFKNGEIAEEEYYKRKEEIEKEAAEKTYKMQMWAWTAQLLQIGASTAQAIVTALGSAPPPVNVGLAATVGILGAAQLAQAIRNKPIPPSFAGGGFVGGFNGVSMGQDNTYAHVRTGEAIFNAKQQRELWNLANGRGGASSSGNVNIKNYRGNDTKVSTQFSEDGLQVFIRKIVQEDIANGNMNNSLMKAENSFDGDMYI